MAEDEEDSSSDSDDSDEENNSDADNDSDANNSDNDGKNQHKAIKGKTERRMDPADNEMYGLQEFLAEYGGTADRPPVEWTRQKHTAFWFNE